MKKYKLSFLPLFEEDLNEIVDYISTDLQNPSAADHLIDDIESAIYKRLEAHTRYDIRESCWKLSRG